MLVRWLLAAGLIASGFLTAGVTAPSSPGELSIQPPISIGNAAPPSTHIVTRPSWQHDWHVGAVASASIATDAQTAYLSTSRNVCAVSLATGNDHWCQGTPARSLALSGETLATVESDGVVRGRDRARGLERWRSVVGPVPATGATIDQDVWPTHNGFLVRRQTPSGTTVAELRTNGEMLWMWSSDFVLGDIPTIANDYAAVTGAGRGTASSHGVIFRLGQGGGEIANMVPDSKPLDIRPPELYALISPMSATNVPTDINIDISVFDLERRTSNVTWRFAPDKDVTMRLPFQEPVCCGVYKRVGIEGGYLYAAVGERVYRYLLGAPDEQRPILLSDTGPFVAGPYRGRVYVSKPDGVWSASFNGRFVSQMRALAFSLPISLSAIAFNGDTGYATMSDGHVSAFAVDSGEPFVRAKVACTQFASINVVGSRAIVSCAAPTPRVFAFSR